MQWSARTISWPAAALTCSSSRDCASRDDVAVIGHDNWSVLTSSSRPALTSIDNETETIGRRAARYLVDAIDGNPHHGVDYVPCHLIQRESTLPLD